MMRLLVVAALGITVAFAGQPATAQQGSGEKLWYGIYTVKNSRRIEDPRSPTGTRYVNDGAQPPSRNESRVRWNREIYFGLGYRMNGPRGQRLEVEEVYFLPNRGIGARAQPSSEPHYRIKNEVSTGEEYFMGWFTGDNLSGTPPGEWTLQVRYQDRVIIEQKFTVEEQ